MSSYRQNPCWYFVLCCSDVSPAVDKLAALLAQNEPSTETHSLDNSLILATANC